MLLYSVVCHCAWTEIDETLLGGLVGFGREPMKAFQLGVYVEAYPLVW